MNSKKIDLDKCLNVAIKLAVEAGDLIRSLYQSELKIERKADKSIVTEADFRADRLIRGGLEKAFPDHRLLTEEGGFSGFSESDYTWLVDPLDGTKAFAYGVPGFCVMIGLLEKEKPVLGVVFDPLTGRLFEARKGNGSYLSDRGEGTKKRLFVSKRSDFSEMPLITSNGIAKDASIKIKEFLGGPILEPIRSVGIKVGMMVEQQADIYVSSHSVSYWDSCAPQAILEEAGGLMTGLGNETLIYDLANSSARQKVLLFASNGQRHQDLCKTLSPLFFD